MRMRTLVPFAVLSGMTLSSFAVPITPGGPTRNANNALTVTNDGTVASISGTLNASTFSGFYAEYVIRDGSNPYGVDDLTFLITIANNAGSQSGIEHVADGGGAGFGLFPGVNVGYLAGAGEFGMDVPVSVDETSSGTVEFNFPSDDAIAAGTGTEYLVIQTAATNVATGTLGFVGTSSSVYEDGFIPASSGPPTTVTPEPSSFALLSTGLLSVAGLIRKRLA